jgi:hypothetical protein
MAIKAPGTGPLSIGEIATEFGGTAPHSLGEYYRGGGLVPLPISANPGVPTSGQISISDFYGARNATIVTYQLIGGGGAGGFGLEDGFGSGQAAAGTASSLTGPGISISAPGGAGGNNGSLPEGASGAGQGTVFGPGGASIGNGSAGRPAPATSYGAGGGGAGGDSPNRYDPSGACGDGGFASPLQNGTLVIPYGTVLSITIGVGGVGSGGNYPGGAGANGVCVLTYDGVTYVITSTTSYTVL